MGLEAVPNSIRRRHIPPGTAQREGAGLHPPGAGPLGKRKPRSPDDRGFSAAELMSLPGLSGELCLCVGYCLFVAYPLALHFDNIPFAWE